MISGRKLSHPLVLLIATLLLALPVGAMPSFLVGKNDAKRVSHATHIALMRTGERTVVTVMSDYEGPAEPFVVVMPVPADVTMDHVRTLKRDSLERLDTLTAPRVFHFWEKDPCELGKAMQVWERDLSVKAGSGMKMMGAGQMDFSAGTRKAPKELSWHLEIETKAGEYDLFLLLAPEPEAAEEEGADDPGKKKKAKQAAPKQVPQVRMARSRAKKEKAERAAKAKEDAADEEGEKDEKGKPGKPGKPGKKGKKGKKGEEDAVAEEEEIVLPPATEWAAWLRQRGYQVSAEQEKALAPYIQAGMNVLIGEIDHKMMELIGGGRAQMSPLQYYTDLPMTKLPVTLGLLNMDQTQELFIYTLHPQQRWEVANYPNITPPTNLVVRERLGKLWVQERIGEVYANLQDRLLKKQPGSFLSEYAFPTDTCGEPCTTDKITLWELLTLGGDQLDLALPEEEQFPEPEPYTEKEEEAFKSELEVVEPKDRKKFKKERALERKEVARRKGMAKRHKYVLSRVHARYDRAFLKQDVELRAGKAFIGGVDIPKGPEGTLPQGVTEGEANKYQIRYVTLHPWPGVQKCENPKRWRWGLEWRSVRRLNKIWIASDLNRRPRDRMKPEEVFLSPIPEIGFAGGTLAPADAGSDAGPPVEVESSGGCGCRTASTRTPGGAAALLGLLLGAALLRRRRR